MWSAKKGAIGLLRSVDGAGAANGFDSCLGRVTRCTRSRSMLKSMLNTEEHTAAPPSSTKTCLVAYDHPAVTHSSRREHVLLIRRRPERSRPVPVTVVVPGGR